MTQQSKQNNFGFDYRKESGPVECLGMTFNNDDERRTYFAEKLGEKLKEPEFRKIEGFPIGEDEDILALSDPPYYSACPNPFIKDFVNYYGKPFTTKDKYHREPFAADVTEGKNDPIYNAHSYHTKVPHKAIMRYILHYTEPGDIVFDGFCGTGMTGVAAQLCGDRTAVESLGLRVTENGTIFNEEGKPISKLGVRWAILNDLSPSAMFIAYNYNTPVDIEAFKNNAKKIYNEVEQECGWMYETIHKDGKTFGRINYTVWSDVFICPECIGEVVFWEAAFDKKTSKVNKEFECTHCKSILTKRNTKHAWETKYDDSINKTIKQAKQVPVLINYSIGKKRFIKSPDEFDLKLIEKIEKSKIPYWFPTDRMMLGSETRRNDPTGLTHVHHFFTKRNLYTLSAIRSRTDLHTRLLFQSIVATLCSRLVRYNMGHRGNGPLSGTLYVSSLNAEADVLKVFTGKTKDFARAFCTKKKNILFCQSLSNTDLKTNSLDYIFVDPPFGSNLNYSELNFIWESWLKIWTDTKPEAIQNKAHAKGIDEYRNLITACFRETFRVLKPGRWMTVEFSNTSAAIWNSIQTSLQEVGFVIANVAALDKKQGSFKAVTTPTAVKQDLVISAYKPNGGLEKRFVKLANTEEGIWDFIKTHLKNLPVVKPKGGRLEFITERDPRILYDRAVAFYIRHSFPVPLSSPEFQAGLAETFSERDGMYFLPDQAAEYDKKRIKMEGLGQMAIWVEDERSAADWLRNFLKNKPSKYQEIQPEFFEKLNEAWKKWETRPELQALLDQYFLCYNGQESVPPQIHSYLSTNFKDLRKLPADDPMLRSKAKDRWYVPDPRKNADVEKLREKRLLEEFWSYLPPGYDVEAIKRRVQSGQETLPGMESLAPKVPKGKRLKLVRTEAVRVGFKQCYQFKDYQTIIAVAHYIPENVVNGDDQLQMIYDAAVTRSGLEI